MRYLIFITPLLLASLYACTSSTPSNVDDDDSTTGAGATTGTGGSGTGGSGGMGAGDVGGCGPDTSDPNEDLGPGADPEAGDFTLDEALAGLPEGSGPLRAIITTEVGEITCTFEPTMAPITVANFVGLARGVRPWQDPNTSNWVKRRYYDGLEFHRIIDDFMAQGGDPTGSGSGSPGYTFVDEFTSLVHTPGTLSMANRGPNTNGSQFFITEIATSNLDGVHTVFGYCEPMSVVQALTSVPTDGSDHPMPNVHSQTVEITRCPL